MIVRLYLASGREIDWTVHHPEPPDTIECDALGDGGWHVFDRTAPRDPERRLHARYNERTNRRHA